ncbi:MAG: NAD-dependent epimerase/dehydratase family protein [Candidatus Dormibacteraceae bacterium]
MSSTRKPERRALVTGGTGFIGSYVARLLSEQGRTVSMLGRSRHLSAETRFVLGPWADRVSVHEAAIEDSKRITELIQDLMPTEIVHLAAIVDPPALQENPALAFTANVGGTVTVLEAARRFHVERVVFFSSIGVLPPIQYEPIDAAHPIILPRHGPGSGAYGAAKAAGELFCLAYQQSFGLNVRIVRPSATYGFGMRSHSANYMKQFVEPAVRGQPVKLASGGSLPRDYTHVLDVASLSLAVLEAGDDTDRVFFAATGEPLVTAAECANIVRELVPGSDIEIGPGLSDEDRLEVSFRGVLSIDNAWQQLGWKPRYRLLREGIAEYIDRYREFMSGEPSGYG